MKRVVSLVIMCCMCMQLVVFADGESSSVDIQISGDTEYSTESITEYNCGTLKSVATIEVSGEYDYYTLNTSSYSAEAYSTKDLLFSEVGVDDKLNGSSFVHTTKPGKYTVNIAAYKGDKIVGNKDFDVECKLNDNREKITPKSIKVGGEQFTQFNADIKEYKVNTESVDYNTTVEVETENGDTSNIIKDGNKTYIVLFNQDKSKNSIYSVEFTYDYVTSFDVEVSDSGNTQDELSYKCKYSGVDITDIVSVNIDPNSGYSGRAGQIEFIKSGLTTVTFSIGNVSVEKNINVTGEDLIDEPQHTTSIDDLDGLVVGDIIEMRYTSKAFVNDNRYKIKSSNESIVKVIGNYFVVVGSGSVEISAEHQVKGAIGRYTGTAVKYTDTVQELMPDIDSINMLTGNTHRVECRVDGTYDSTVKYKVVDGSSIELYGNTLLGVKRGTSKLKVSSGRAERVVDVNVMTVDTVIPVKISIENKSSNFVLNKESIFHVNIEPEGATVSTSDIAVSSNKKAKVRSVGDNNYGITPEEVGDHTITVKIQKYSLESSVLANASSEGDVDNPDVPGTKVDVEKIVLEDTYISLEVGSTKTIRVKNITPASATNKEVKYESMNTRYATVDKNGKVTGERAGTAKINVYSVSNPEIYATCTVNVYDEDDRYDSDSRYRYPVDKVVIYREDNGKEVSIRSGKTSVMVNTEQKFIARIYPYNATNQEVRWYTSNSNIAEVDDDGTLTAYRMGEVELSVVTRDGNHRDSVKVEITEWMLKPTKLTIVTADNETVNTEVKTGDKISLKVNFEPLLTTERDVIWTITEGHSLFTLSRTGDVEFKDIGKATIKVYTKDYSKYADITFNITYSDDYWNDIGSTKNISTKRAIEVKFSEALSNTSLQDGSVFVSKSKDGNTKADNVLLELTQGNQVLRVYGLNGEWDSNSTYYIFIKGTSRSESGKQLIKNCRYTFETRRGRSSIER